MACSACHIMHNSQDGVLIDPNNPDGNVNMLRSDNVSDICLSCHADNYGAVFGSNPLLPPPEKGAGNFVFLLEDNINDGADGLTNPISGAHAGHNIVSQMMGTSADPNYVVAPGGSFPSDKLTCTSCHDPHGNTNYRQLYGAVEVQGGLYTFTNEAPVAEGISLLIGEESETNHNAYISGMSAWCGNCHGAYLNEHNPSSSFNHETLTTIENNVINHYNRYNGTADPIGATYSNAYLAEVPFEDAANTTTSTTGMSATSQIMCVSCHRAHGSSAPYAGRWDFNVDLLADDGVNSNSYPLPDPYNSPTQKELCDKCHYMNKEGGDFYNPGL